jgi:tetratricopeptide (TPR) repeat protein
VSEGLARLGAPPERRVASQLAAGDLHGAARSALEAAKVADSTLAFQRAAEYYGLALELWTGGDDERVELLVQRATAFENALRPSLAGECLQHASRLCRSPERGRELLRLAGEQYLLSGELDKGLGALQQALAEHQLTLPASAPFALGEAMTLMAQLSQRGLVPAARTELSLHLTERIELCLSVARCLHHVDVRGLPFAIRGLLEALDQPSAALRQQAFAVFVMTTAGHLPTPLVAPALETCRALTKAQPTPIAQARLHMAEAEFEYFQGKYNAAERACERAERTLINACVGVSRELGQIRSTLLVMAHSDRGDFRSNAERALSWLEDADRRRDKFYGNWLRASYALVWMAQDQPERARREIARAEAEWPASTGGTFETACALYLDACDRYEDLPGTHQRAAQARATVLQSPVVHSPMLQGYLHLHRAWGALRELGSRPKQHAAASRRTLRRQIQESVANLRKLSVLVWSATADAYEANLFVLDGELDRADDLLERAFSGFVATHHHALAACIRRRWGEVVGGDVGLRWQSESDLELGRLGVVAPARFARAYFSPFSAHSFDRCSEPTLSD